MHHVFEIPFNKKDATEQKKSTACCAELIKVFAMNGYDLYGTNIAFMDVFGETYGPTLQMVFKKIKGALDPKGIISPGKSGIMI
ncbi:hypothetical protein JY97_11390 [Alkalispirochaeta odontotermitis]|nr:hypothetical protein JY97_11390 [Alkalispirochaeta odontotermitis]CAB1076602.1 hypothetical protein D1AOALGA4SA_4398 [Olavius algarvensis Delta 1 endosymbiont]